MLKVVTFNLRNVWDEKDGINSFVHRAGLIFQKITDEMPDIIGFQEVKGYSRKWLYSWIDKEYVFLGQTRDADFVAEGTYIAVKKDAFDIMAFDSFWLSPSPYLPGSQYENSHCPRICNVVRVRHRQSNKIFHVFNTHLDHLSEEIRLLQLERLLEHMEEMQNKTRFPAILMGDFNAKPHSAVIARCKEFAEVTLREVTETVECTFHHFGKMHVKIDYIFMTPELAELVSNTGIWDDESSGIPLSDHYPVFAILDM